MSGIYLYKNRTYTYKLSHKSIQIQKLSEYLKSQRPSGINLPRKWSQFCFLPVANKTRVVKAREKTSYITITIDASRSGYYQISENTEKQLHYTVKFNGKISSDGASVPDEQMF